ncbi:hypothetical protein [Nocardia cyriacigeorgica]|uniref:hypothetical protein n=1 Tax=Nocardia cyriacigeorgica TaxID=135487 RepID=UPI0024547EA4|nr:hypothetical protein [Nocardia cyriacigeorgica]
MTESATGRPLDVGSRRSAGMRGSPNGSPPIIIGMAHHPNGARGIVAVLIVADDAEHAAILRRYQAVLEVEPSTIGPKTVLIRAGTRIEIVPASAAVQVLPGEKAPAPSYLAAVTVHVDDLDRARTLVGESGTETTTTDTGFFVSGRDACGAGLFFTAVR